jgi:hypothetical protein
MHETIERFRDLLVARMGVLEEEILLSEALYKERHGDFSMVSLENTAIFERQAKDVHHAMVLFRSLDLEQFESIEQFRGFALATLQKLYDARVMFRSGIRMLIECVRTAHG